MPQQPYQLPDLAYDYGALAPHISGEIMELHHGKHHAAYVAGANTTLDKLSEVRGSGDYSTITKLEKDLAFHVSGHILHSIFWTNLSPNGGGQPGGPLADQLTQDFGSIEAFQAQMTNAAATVQGSGWAVAGWEPLSQSVIVQQVYDHQGNIGIGTTPLLVIDGWEHAFYLQYKNVKADFFAALWNIVNWDDVATRLTAAQG